MGRRSSRHAHGLANGERQLPHAQRDVMPTPTEQRTLNAEAQMPTPDLGLIYERTKQVLAEVPS
jgi:hypothetical protein